jgi:predicted dehydrogenase
MIVYDDIEPIEKVRVYDKGVTTTNGNGAGGATQAGGDEKEEAYRTLVSYRTGDVWVPKLDGTEALRHVCAEFLASIAERRRPLTDGAAGLRVVRLLEAAQQSISEGGRLVSLAS